MHYIQRWLPLSEQYVDALVRGSAHDGVVVARHRRENRVTFPYEPVVTLGWVPMGTWPLGRSERKLLTARLLATAVRGGVDLVHHHHGYRLGDCDGLVRRRRLPLVVSVHGHDVTSFAHHLPHWFFGHLADADAVIVPSQFLAAHVVDHGCDPARVHTIPAGVDRRWFTPTPLPDGPRELVFIGRFVEKKGLDTLLAAWPLVRAAVPGAVLRVVGHGPLEALVRSAGEGVVVEATDPTRRAEQVRDALRRAWAVVTPSHAAGDGDVETLLLVNLEAQATGRPLVTTRHGGIPEFVAEGTTALLVAESAPVALAEALVAVLTDDALAERMAAAGPAWVKQFDVVCGTARVDALYESLVAR